MQDNGLYSHGSYLLAVSGGRDSMMLLDSLRRAIDGDLLNIICVDYKTGQSGAKLVSEYCLKYQLKFKILTIPTKLLRSNFEHQARLYRYEQFNHYLKQNHDAKCYLGHHIDDSYEWSLLQMFKSTNIHKSIGIPLVNDRYIRPLMCFSRDHINQYMTKYDVPFVEDLSNGDLHYERNFIRHTLVKEIKERYPKYLERYCVRAKQMALDCDKLHMVVKSTDLRIESDKFGGVILYRKNYSNDMSGYISEITSIIEKLSESERGLLYRETEKLLAAFKVGRSGPMHFSGGVKVFLFSNVLYFSSKRSRKLISTYDDSLPSLTPIKSNSRKLSSFSNLWISTSKQKNLKESPLAKTLLPKLSSLLKKEGLYLIDAHRYYMLLQNKKIRANHSVYQILE